MGTVEQREFELGRTDDGALAGMATSGSTMRSRRAATRDDPGRLLTRRMILENVWGRAHNKELHYLKVYADRVRHKLHDEHRQIMPTDPSVGYRLPRQ